MRQAITSADGMASYLLGSWDGSTSAVVTMEKDGYDRQIVPLTVQSNPVNETLYYNLKKVQATAYIWLVTDAGQPI